MIWPLPPSSTPASPSSGLPGGSSGSGSGAGTSTPSSLADDGRTAHVTRSAPTMLDRIRASLPALSPAEQRVGKLVLADPRSFSSLPVAELADRSHVSKPTVVRFCRSVGYDGLADFKLKLAGTVNEGVPFVHRAVDEDDKPNDLIVKVIDNSVSALLKYRGDVAAHAMERAIEALTASARDGRRIQFYGVGNSGIVAQDAQHKFFRLGVNAVAFSDGHVQVMAATMLQPGDCAVMISNSGRTRDLLDAAEIARRKGAQTIVISCSGSPLAHQAQVLLAVDHPEDYDRYSPMVSRLLHLTVIDILTTAVALRLGPDLRPMLQEIKRNLRAKRYASPE
jgi:RpiR family carbohydrate utilization transcriptional regulator